LWVTDSLQKRSCWPSHWYLRYGLSYRDVEELLAERLVEVGHVTIYRWV
jgi:transposase-like protein